MIHDQLLDAFGDESGRDGVPSDQATADGGGLAGMPAVDTVLENGGSVVLLDKFTSDTLRGGAKKPELAKVLCENSGADVEWLLGKFSLDLSVVARLGGCRSRWNFAPG